MARSGSRKRITGSAAMPRPLHHGSRRTEVTGTSVLACLLGTWWAVPLRTPSGYRTPLGTPRHQHARWRTPAAVPPAWARPYTLRPAEREQRLATSGTCEPSVRHLLYVNGSRHTPCSYASYTKRITIAP